MICSAGDPADRRPVLDRMRVEALQELVEAVGVSATPFLVDEPGVGHRSQHPQCQRRVGARDRAQVLVGDPGGAASERVDDAEPGTVAARVEKLAPQMGRGRHRVPAPDQQVAGVVPLLRVDLGRDALGRDHAGDPGGGADRAHELRRPDRVHQPVRDRAALDRPLGAHVAVGEHRLAAVLVDRPAHPLRREVERLVPARGAELAVALGAAADQRLEDAVGGVDAVEVVGDLAAEEAGGDRVLGIAADADRAAVLVDRGQHRAGVRAVVRTGPLDDALRHGIDHPAQGLLTQAGRLVESMRLAVQSREVKLSRKVRTPEGKDGG